MQQRAWIANVLIVLAAFTNAVFAETDGPIVVVMNDQFEQLPTLCQTTLFDRVFQDAPATVFIHRSGLARCSCKTVLSSAKTIVESKLPFVTSPENSGLKEISTVSKTDLFLY